MIHAGGGVAQGLEQAAHNRLVVGSNPTAPTMGHFLICYNKANGKPKNQTPPLLLPY